MLAPLPLAPEPIGYKPDRLFAQRVFRCVAAWGHGGHAVVLRTKEPFRRGIAYQRRYPLGRTVTGQLRRLAQFALVVKFVAIGATEKIDQQFLPFLDVFGILLIRRTAKAVEPRPTRP